MTSLLIEFATIGFLAGLIATIGAEASLFYLQQEVFEQDFSFHYWVWPLGPLIGMGVIGVLGFLSTKGVVQISPLSVLRRSFEDLGKASADFGNVTKIAAIKQSR